MDLAGTRDKPLQVGLLGKTMQVDIVSLGLLEKSPRLGDSLFGCFQNIFFREWGKGQRINEYASLLVTK